MTKHDNAQSGEERFRRRRNSFWRYLALAFVGFAIAGFISGYAQDSYKAGDLPTWVPITLAIMVCAALIWFTWDYFRRVDELDLMDNLWAHLIGTYTAVIVFMGWYLSGDLGLSSYPTAFGVMCALIAGTFVAYCLRKLGFR
ncbi:hypothetical protein [Erythrobacter rubeus]|uniref:Uncharacterized protein n=1 Tax=Erythrobacter rubeus TaxID=2760803 RepID=A0ABR8KUA9_9SPHN|nr:hypothetical protein [Erythrobacter rubeus]MBD2841842.1 hypothetical protein [Erythrobacter rubeus]